MPVRQLPPHTPNTDGKLWDVLHEMFGIGTFDEFGEKPWWKFRQQETAKVKASRIKNNRSLADLYVAALYCRAHGIDVRAVTFLMRHINSAWSWWEDTRERSRTGSLTERYAEAVRQEMANTDDTWLNRLLRAAPSAREEVYQQWTERR